MGRLPPASLEAEQSLLGTILLNNRALEKVGEFLLAEHFQDPVHRALYDKMKRLIETGHSADEVTLAPFCDSDPGIKAAGGVTYLADLAGAVGSIINAADYGRLIHDLALRRELIDIGSDMVNNAHTADFDLPAGAQIEQAEQRLFDLSVEGSSDGGFATFAKAMDIAVREAEAAHRRHGRLAGITSGFVDLDNRLGGLHKSDLIIIAGRPGMGKTALATNIAYNAAETFLRDRMAGSDSSGAPVAFFSLEMSADQLAMRVLAGEVEISAHRMRTGDLEQEQFAKLARCVNTLEQLPLFIDDTASVTLSTIRTRARRLARTNRDGLGLIVVDYLQLISGSPGRSQDNRVQELSAITRGLKILAKELHVPVIALSQLSRQVESREDKRPQLSDLRESGSIEQDADVVMFVYREAYYHEQKEPHEKGTEDHLKWQERMEQIRHRADVIVAKQRHGPTGTVPLYFDGRYTKFGNLDRHGVDDYPGAGL